jgi:hypothetical protein
LKGKDFAQAGACEKKQAQCGNGVGSFCLFALGGVQGLTETRQFFLGKIPLSLILSVFFDTSARIGSRGSPSPTFCRIEHLGEQGKTPICNAGATTHDRTSTKSLFLTFGRRLAGPNIPLKTVNVSHRNRIYHHLPQQGFDVVLNVGAIHPDAGRFFVFLCILRQKSIAQFRHGRGPICGL